MIVPVKFFKVIARPPLTLRPRPGLRTPRTNFFKAFATRLRVLRFEGFDTRSPGFTLKELVNAPSLLNPETITSRPVWFARLSAARAAVCHFRWSLSKD